MQPATTGQPAAIESHPEDAALSQTEEQDLASLNFEQLIVPGLGSGPLIPESVSKLFRKLVRRKDKQG